MSKPSLGLILKIAVFATGLAGIVAEFVLSTLATYILGDAVLQWTVVMSLMLFAMGLGSRLSKVFRRDLLDAFIVVEFALSLLCASASALAYGLFGWTSYVGPIIYGQALLVGGLIGCEIPLVTRLNQSFQELPANIASVMEKDYYGALLGGLFFAFFALPRLGLTYTPVVLGAVNFAVASLFIFLFFRALARKALILAAFGLCALGLIALAVFSEPIMSFGEQAQYKDKVILARQTPYQKIVLTEFRDYHWLYINGQVQFSSFDEEKYHEPLAHPGLLAARERKNILILGGGDGLALREVLKHPEVKSVTLVDLDPAMTDLARSHPVLLRLNQGSLLDRKVRVVNQDAAAFLRADQGSYDVALVDLPDPDTIDLMHVYSLSFYRLLERRLSPGGVLATQATSPYFAPKAFRCLIKTIRAAGFSALPYHNQVPTMGELGFVLAARAAEGDEENLKARVLRADFDRLPTRFLNRDAVVAMTHFGRGVLQGPPGENLAVNTQLRPVLHAYYAAGKWAMY